MSPTQIIYKILPEELWLEAIEAGALAGAGIDKKDGYIHFSTGEQVEGTALQHFPGVKDLVLVAIDRTALEETCGEDFKMEPSRGGDLFPHLYVDLPLSAVLWTEPLPWLRGKGHSFPERMKA